MTPSASEISGAYRAYRRQDPTLIHTLGGRAADIVLGSGPNAGAESDLAGATSILLGAIERQGLRGGLVYVPEMGMRRSEVMTIVEAQLNRLLKRAIAIVEADRKLAIKLAERLMAERILSGADVEKALDAPAATLRPMGRRGACSGPNISAGPNTGK